MHLIQEMFSYPFMQRAFVVGILVSLCAALLGPSMVLKRYAMIGDGLSHVGFGTLAAATMLHTAPLAISLPVVILAAFLLLRLKESSFSAAGCCHCPDLHRLSCLWRDGNLNQHRHEYRCLQLSLRHHTGCHTKRTLAHCVPLFVCDTGISFLVSPYFFHHL